MKKKIESIKDYATYLVDNYGKEVIENNLEVKLPGSWYDLDFDGKIEYLLKNHSKGLKEDMLFHNIEKKYHKLYIKFKFQNGQKEIINILAPEDVQEDECMYGISLHIMHVSYPNYEYDTSNPQKWVDDYNELDVEQGNIARETTGDCIGYEILND